MKIALVLDDSLDAADGVQQYVLTLGRWLSSQGHEVHYLVGQTRRRDMDNLHSLSRNIRVRFNGNRMSMPLPASKSKLRDLLQKEKFDVLHVQAPYSPFLAGRIIKLAPKSTAVVATFHIIPYSRLQLAASRILAVACQRSLRRINQAVSVSTAAQSFARTSFRLETEIVPNAIDYDHFYAAKSSLDNSPACTIVFLGRHVKRKGCKELLLAVRQLKSRDDFGSLRFIIGGTGPLTAGLKRYTAQHGLDTNVTFPGYIAEDAKAKYLAQADIAVFPSLGGESFGIVLAEAMAAGAGVVIGGDNPGYRCVLGDWQECLFDPSDENVFARRLSKLIDDSALRRRLHKSQQQAVRQYDVSVVGGRLEQLYKSAIAKNSFTGDN